MTGWTLHWYYFGDIASVMYTPDPPCGENVAQTVAEGRRKALETLTPNCSGLDEPFAVALTREVVGSYPGRTKYPWDDWPANLEVLVRQPPEGGLPLSNGDRIQLRARDFTVGPKRIILFAPLNDDFGDAGAIRCLTGGSSEILALKDGEYDPETDVLAGTMFDAADDLLVRKVGSPGTLPSPDTPPGECRRILTEWARSSNATDQRPDFALPPEMVVLSDSSRASTETALWFDGGCLTLVLGTQGVPLGNSLTGIRLADWPCGAFQP